ncbi:MAG: hypothetical protein FWD47_04980 [Treponema sp.]|nr:hypothetical protein [Treponema sp.]
MINIIKQFFNKRAQRKREIEQKRREEFELLRQKQKENEAFVLNVKNGLNEIQKTYKELEDTEKRCFEIFRELEDKSMQIETLSEKSYKFIFKLINDWNIRKLTNQCKKQKQQLEKYSGLLSDKKEELRFSLSELLNSVN